MVKLELCKKTLKDWGLYYESEQVIDHSRFKNNILCLYKLLKHKFVTGVTSAKNDSARMENPINQKKAEEKTIYPLKHYMKI